MNENVIPPVGAMPITRSSTVVDSGNHVSAVSWAAIFAGAAGAAALSLILLVLGTGIGLSSVSPWANKGVSAETFGISTAIWVTLTSIAASGMGGYLAGRLRSRWHGTHSDEVYFRDTAHGFLAWAVATIVTAGLLTSAIGSIAGTGVQAGASVAGGAVTAAAGAAAAAAPNAGPNRTGYFVDTLFRKDPSVTTASPVPSAPDDAARATAEVGRIMTTSMANGSLTPADATYIGQLVAQRTGLSQADAEKRVNDTFAKAQATVKDAEQAAREAADKAKKASASAALWLFVSLLVGAFVASLAATYGGRRRDLI